MLIDGELSITAVLGLRRMTKELDRTLELALGHLDALSAKGTFLVRLPSVLGGYREKGEKSLRYVLLKEPQSVNARLSLAKSYCANGRHSEALSLFPKRWISPNPNERTTSLLKRQKCWLSSGPTPPRQISSPFRL